MHHVCTVLAPNACDMTQLYLQKAVLIVFRVTWLQSGLQSWSTLFTPVVSTDDDVYGMKGK